MRRYEDDDSWFSRSKRSIAKFQIAKDKLGEEVDMKNIIIYQRVSNFLNRIHSSRRQRLSVDYFRRYTVTDTEIGRKKLGKKGMTENRIINECQPTRSDIDKRILFEMTGVKLDRDEFSDESSLEEDLSVLVNQVIGYSRGNTGSEYDKKRPLIEAEDREQLEPDGLMR